MKKMTKDEIKTRLLEDKIFEELKDGYFGGISYIRLKYEGTDIDASKIYRRICNYRIAKYGSSTMISPKYIEKKTKEERLKESNNRRNRRKARGIKICQE